MPRKTEWLFRENTFVERTAQQVTRTPTIRGMLEMGIPVGASFCPRATGTATGTGGVNKLDRSSAKSPFLFGHAVHRGDASVSIRRVRCPAGLLTLDSYPICVVLVERELDEIPHCWQRWNSTWHAYLVSPGPCR
jgi:hypothetical protein